FTALFSSQPLAMLAGALQGATRRGHGPTRAIPWASPGRLFTVSRQADGVGAGAAAGDPRGRRTHRLLAVDRKTDPHTPRAPVLPVRGQRQIDFLHPSNRRLDSISTIPRRKSVSLFKRGNVWWLYFYQDGVRHQSSTGTSNRRRAETIAAK